MISYQVLHPVLHSPRRCAKPPFLGVSECKYGVRTPDRALTITVFTDIGAVGTVIFLCAGNKKVLACFFESGFSYIFFDGIIFQNVDYNTIITI